MTYGGHGTFEAAMSQFMGGVGMNLGGVSGSGMIAGSVSTMGGVIIPRSDEQIAQDILQRYSGGIYPADAFDPSQTGSYILDDDDDDDEDDYGRVDSATTSGLKMNSGTGSGSGGASNRSSLDFMRAHTNFPTRTELNHCLSRVRLFCLNHYSEFQNELRWINELEVKINRSLRN